MLLFYILTVLVVKQLYAFVKSHGTMLSRRYILLYANYTLIFLMEKRTKCTTKRFTKKSFNYT